MVVFDFVAVDAHPVVTVSSSKYYALCAGLATNTDMFLCLLRALAYCFFYCELGLRLECWCSW